MVPRGRKRLPPKKGADGIAAADILSCGGGEMTAEEWKNKLYFGDNLAILRDHVDDESVDLAKLAKMGTLSYRRTGKKAGD